jgi:trk system potassium uptake protein TrkA
MKVVVCGAGQVGFGIARHLAGEGNDVTVVDRDPSLMQRISDTLDVRPVLGHGGHPDVLETAGAADADILIAVTASDEVNMVTCQVAKTLFNPRKTVARVRDRQYLTPRWQQLFNNDNTDGHGGIGIDVIISPETEVGNAVIRRLALPGAFDNASFCAGDVQLIGISIEEDCPVVDTPLNQLTGLFPDLGAIVVSIRRNGKLYVPRFDDTMEPGDEAYVVTSHKDTERTLKIFGHEERAAQRIVIMGGGNIGFQVARQLSLQGSRFAVSVIENREERARQIAEKLPRAVVLHGDCLTPEILVEAGVRSADLALGLTNDDQINILSTMLARQEGSASGLCLINENSLQTLAGQFGMDAAINPRAITVSSVLSHVRRGRVKRVHAVGDAAAEVLEAEILDNSPLSGLKLRDAELPDGMRLGAIMRGRKLIMPRGGTDLRSGDIAVAFVMADILEDAEKLFSGETESA